MTARHIIGFTALALGIGLAGCGTPGAPLPPSLNLPDPVTNLSAVRNGNQVALSWTMPKRNTDRLLLKGNLPVKICRQEPTGPCAPAGQLLLAAGSDGTFTDALPPAEASGNPRVLTYRVDLPGPRNRSAGPSNPATVLAGQAPEAVEGLAAKVVKAGAILTWTPGNESALTAVRLHRTLLTPAPEAKPIKQESAFGPQREPPQQSLLVEAGGRSGRALDKQIRFGQTYEYSAQRVTRVIVGNQTLELAGPLSAPIRVEVVDIFPPAIPTGLAAVATAEATGASIDLSWQPDADTDLAGYIVYRREGEAPWQRISPPEPVPAPAFHDAQTQPGHTYHYAVSSIDQGGHESPRSAEAQETVPNP